MVGQVLATEVAKWLPAYFVWAETTIIQTTDEIFGVFPLPGSVSVRAPRGLMASRGRKTLQAWGGPNRGFRAGLVPPPQPGTGSRGTSPAPAIRHVPGDGNRPRPGQDIGLPVGPVWHSPCPGRVRLLGSWRRVLLGHHRGRG